MKPNELMIGDWVSYGNVYGKVWCLDEASNLVGLDLPDNISTQDAHFEDIFPIPLTPEILEKNGWVNEHFGTQRQEWWLDKTKFPIVRYSVNDTLHHNGIVLKFVHQLQHALRLCGIDKEIEL